MKILGKVAIYKEKQYQFVDLNNGKYSLISNDERDEKIGFEKIGINDRYAKDIYLKELDFVFEKKTIVLYKGDEFIGSVIEGNKIMLYTRNVMLGKKYSMIMRDKDEHYLYIDLKDVDEIIQKWVPLKQYME